MGILFTILMGFLFTITMGILFTIVLGIQFTISMNQGKAPGIRLKVLPEAPRAIGSQCFQQIEDRPLDIKSAGQTVSYGEKMGLKYLDVKIYDVLDGLRKCAKILSY